MVHIKDKDIFQIREQLFTELVESSKIINIRCEFDKNNPISNLRKRYKATPCYEDIYVISMSIIEDTPHKDLIKIVTKSPQVKSMGTLHTTDTAIIALMHEMKDQLNSIRKENKDLKDKMDILCTKVDHQSKIITDQGKLISELHEKRSTKDNSKKTI